MKPSFKFTSVIVLILSLFVNTYAITWFPKEFTCPVDNEKNTFMVIGSYGSYIYFYPSKYQWLFFPNTDSQTFYLCKKCHLSTFMWDFDELPKDKIPEIKKLLSGITVSKTFKEYNEISVTERLQIMEKVYSVLAKDSSWWERFYRIQGYHYSSEGKQEKAAEARKKSLNLIEAELKRESSETPKKLLLYISASMKHFLEDDKGAIADLELASKTLYQEKGLDAEKLKDSENGMNERISDYIAKIKSDKKPRTEINSIDRDEH